MTLTRTERVLAVIAAAVSIMAVGTVAVGAATQTVTVTVVESPETVEECQ